MKYKKITHITLLFAMAFNSTRALAETKYFANRTKVTDGSGSLIGYNYTEWITPELARLNRTILKRTVYELESDVKVINNSLYVPINTGAVNPIPPPVHHNGPAAIILDPTAVNPDPLTTSALSPEVSSLNKDLQILSELSKVDVTSLTEDYSPEQIEAISNEINNFYTTTLGDVTSPEKALEISHIATKNDIDLKKYYNPNPNYA